MSGPPLSSYAGCRFRIPQRGGRVLWQVTNACNFRCRYCIFGSGRADRDELSTNDALRVLDELRALDFRHIKFTGGEPFLRRDLTRLLEHALQSGMPADVSTNGSLITAAHAAALAKIGLPMVHVGLDGPAAEISEAVRGPGSFAAAVRGIRRLVQAGVHTRIGCVLFRGNQHCLEAMADFCATLGVRELVFSLMKAAGPMQGDHSREARIAHPTLAGRIDTLALRYGQTLRISHNLREQPDDRCRACPALENFLYIDQLGRISPCSWVVEYWPEFRGSLSLKSHSLQACLAAAGAPAFRRRFAAAGCPAEGVLDAAA